MVSFITVQYELFLVLVSCIMVQHDLFAEIMFSAGAISGGVIISYCAM